MNRIQVVMIKTKDQLEKGQSYTLPLAKVKELIATGYIAGPSEIKPAGPAETKVIPKRKRNA